MSAFVLPPTSASIGMRAGSATATAVTRVPKLAFTEEKENDEKSSGRNLATANDGDEMAQSYIPLILARTRMSELSSELGAMKSKHLALIDAITAKYEKLTNDSRAHFESVVDEVKARASLRLKENKALVEELREELANLQEEHAKKSHQYRTELKQATKEQGRLQQEVLDREAEAVALRNAHEADTAALAARQAELDRALATRVPKEEYDALQAEKAQLTTQHDETKREYETKLAAIETDTSEKKTRLVELEATLVTLREAEEAAKQRQSELEEQLQQARAELDTTRADLERTRADLEELRTKSSEETEQLTARGNQQREESERQQQELTEKLTAQEAKVAELESALLVAQAAAGSGSGSGDGPARIVTVPDPELQTKVRALESELNKLGRENVDLCRLITEREEAIARGNENLAAAKKEAKEQQVMGGGANAASRDEGEPGEEDAVSEYENVSTDEEVEETIPDPNASDATPSDAAAVDLHASKRIELTTLQTTHDADVTRLVGLVSDLEREIKPKVLDYKTRLAEFKTDAERKELEATLGYTEIQDEDGTTHELRPADLRELEDMLEWSAAQAETKPQLASRVAVLKENKARLEENKTRLAALKAEIGEMQARTDPPASKEDIESKEKEFLTLRTQMQADATELKAAYATYEVHVKEFKEKEAQLQKLYAKFKVDGPTVRPAEDADKPRRLSPEHRAQVERLVSLIKNKGKERDALKALAEEVNVQNARLKELRAERDAAQAKASETKAELEALPPPPAPGTGAAAPAEVKMITRTVKRRVTKRVKKPKKQTSSKRSSATSTAVAGSTPMIPSDILTRLKPIELNGPTGKYVGREFTPVTPATFKAGPSAEALSAIAASSSANSTSPSSTSSVGHDPALQAKYDALSQKASRLETELATLRAMHAGRDDVLAAKEAELADLRAQLRTMSEGDIDERVAALSAQLESQRAEVAATHAKHQTRMAELNESVAHAKDETTAAQAEVQKMKADLQAMQGKLKAANARATAAAAAGGAAAAPAASSDAAGVPGGVDPSIVAALESDKAALESEKSELESQVSALTETREAQLATIAELQRKVVALEAEIATHSGSLAEQLAAKEAELTKAHEARVTELEAQVSEGAEKLRITKKKAKELHDALQAETATRQGLEATVAEREATIQSMETSTKAAIESMEGLKGEIKQRDTVIETKKSEIVTLEEKKAALEADVAFLEVRNAEEVKRRKEFQFKYEDAKGKVRVYARVRPFSKAEIAAGEKTLLRPGTNEWTLCINETTKNYQGVVTDSWRPIEFDHVFQFGLENTKGNASQVEVFRECEMFAELTVQGINTCIFAYGQSGTGKTFTMAGIKPSEANGFTTELLGLKPRMIERVYQMKDELRKTHDIDISAYMMEIYLNKLEDVFWKLQTSQKYAGKEKSKWPEPPELKVRTDAKRKVTIDNSIIVKFDTAKEMQEFCDAAELTRRVRKTGLNEESSRSHLIFAIIATATDKKTGKKTTGKLSLVDLAGSERADKTNVDGLSKAARAAMLEEGIAINESLRMLKSVFRILGEQNKPLEKGKKAEIVQYRGNMLTELMQDSLGGNAKTLMFVNVGPAASNISESVDSLAYGDLVKNITNEKVSADADNEEQIRFLGAQLRAYEAKFGPLNA